MALLLFTAIALLIAFITAAAIFKPQPEPVRVRVNIERRVRRRH